MKLRFLAPVIVLLITLAPVALSGCWASSLLSTGESEEAAQNEDVIIAQDQREDAASSASTLDNFGMPAEVKALFEGHELLLSGNPLLGTYTTTSGCTMILMEDGNYSWQDTPDTQAITGTYLVYEGSLDGRDNENAYTLESDTGPIYTVFVTFDEGQGASDFTVQVFDFQNDDLYYVSDLVNNIWFEATRTKSN